MNEHKDRHDKIAAFLDGDIEEENIEINAASDEVPVVKTKPNRKRAGRKRGSMYENFRRDNGKIDYNLAYRRKKGVVEISTLSKEDKKRVTFEKGTRILYVQCPVCHGVRPLIVKLGSDGNPLKKHEAGIDYKIVDGVLQRRFSGPSDDYLPLMTKFTYGRYGQYVNVEESMAISTLKRVDHDLFNDFKGVLEKSLFKFK